MEDKNIMEKEPISFSVELSKPDVKVSWLKDGLKVSASEDFDIKMDGCIHTLTKKEASLEDAGKYMLVFEDKKTDANLGVTGIFRTIFPHNICYQYWKNLWYKTYIFVSL